MDFHGFPASHGWFPSREGLSVSRHGHGVLTRADGHRSSAKSLGFDIGKKGHKPPIWEWFIPYHHIPPIYLFMLIWGMVYYCFTHITDILIGWIWWNGGNMRESYTSDKSYICRTFFWEDDKSLLWLPVSEVTRGHGWTTGRMATELLRSRVALPMKDNRFCFFSFKGSGAFKQKWIPQHLQ